MNGHRPCFMVGIMPGLWKHWQGQINHTSFSLGLENIEERMNESAKGGWKTHSLLLDGLQFYSVPGAWYDTTHGCTQPPSKKNKKKTYQNRDRKITLKETSYWEWYLWVKQRKIPPKTPYKNFRVLWQFTYNGKVIVLDADGKVHGTFTMVFAWYYKVISYFV